MQCNRGASHDRNKSVDILRKQKQTENMTEANLQASSADRLRCAQMLPLQMHLQPACCHVGLPGHSLPMPCSPSGSTHACACLATARWDGAAVRVCAGAHAWQQHEVHACFPPAHWHCVQRMLAHACRLRRTSWKRTFQSQTGLLLPVAPPDASPEDTTLFQHCLTQISVAVHLYSA